MPPKESKNSTSKNSIVKEKKPAAKPEKKVLSPEALERRRRLVGEISGVFLIFFGIFLFVCIAFPQATGIVGITFYNIFDRLFGGGSYIFPPVLIYLGIQLALKGSIINWYWFIFLTFILSLDGVILVHLARNDGGLVGEFIAGHIVRIAGRAGGYLLVILIALTAVMLLTQLTFRQILGWFSMLFVLMGKAVQGLGRFLTFKSAAHEDDREDLDTSMEKVPDLALLTGQETTPLPKEEPEEEEEEEIEDKPPVEAPPEKPKRVIFFDEDDFEDQEEEKEEKSEIIPPPQEKTFTPEEKHDSDVFTSPLEGDTFEMTGGKPAGYEQLDLFTKKSGKNIANPEPISDREPVKNYRYRLPSLNLLRSEEKKNQDQPLHDYSKILEETLANFGVTVKVLNFTRGPTVTRYELQPAKGVKVSKITNLSNDIALALAAYSIRIEAPIPGKSAIGIEVPNHRIEPVFLRDILYEAKYKKHSPLSMALGKDISGKPVMGDLLKMPHLMIAGATGSGKSVCLNGIIASILFKATPLDVQAIMIDPKRVELSLFEGIPHLVDIKLPGGKKIITDPKAATMALKTVSELMDSRYEDFVALRVRNIKEFNERAEVPIPYILVIIDELADLMMVSSSTVEQYICRIAQLGRASGIHLIIATQRPSVDVITGLIKANIPSRVAFAVSSQVDSRTILDRAGAEKLLGKGDMLYLPVDASEPRRIQGAYVSGEEIEKVVDFWKQQPPPENSIPIEIEETFGKGGNDDSDETEDALIPDAIEVIKQTRQASVSNLQRKMKIGYARAGRIMDQLERKGIVGPAQGSKPRKILLPGYTDLD